MESNKKIHKLIFLKENLRTFELIRDGRKKIETRAGNLEYFKIRPGDSIKFICDQENITKIVKKVTRYKDLNELFTQYEFKEINPEVSSYDELKKRYETFPGYEERIKKYGILVFEIY